MEKRKKSTASRLRAISVWFLIIMFFSGVVYSFVGGSGVMQFAAPWFFGCLVHILDAASEKNIKSTIIVSMYSIVLLLIGSFLMKFFIEFSNF